MLFIQSNTLALSPDAPARLRLLDALASKGHTPLLRSARRRLFNSLAPHNTSAYELERACASQQDSEGEFAYTPGELFSADDCVLFMVFGAGDADGLSAGVVYNLDTAAPLARLESFCRDVREAFSTASDLPEWRRRGGRLPEGLARFMALQPAEFVRAAAALRGARDLTRASELMEEQPVRLFLRRVQELRREGYTPRRLFKEAAALSGVSVERMLDAGLLEREVRVSCRKSGHALFDLPSPDSLAAVTLSKAKCSQCAAPVADEVIEETINPTRLAVSLLEDGRWLSNRVYKIVRSLGVPDSEIATGPASAHGESYLAVEVCANSFLFVTRDGDLTPAFARRAAEIVEETEATHIVVVVTGAIEDEGRLRLYEFAWRRARAGSDLGTTFIEGLADARSQIERAFVSAVRRELSHNLFTLDAALGFGAAAFVLDWFKLAKAARSKDEAARAHTPMLVGLDRQAAS